jgi:SAM-dependent methyltransferase
VLGTLQDFVKERFCPSGIWQLSNVMKSVLINEILRFPKGIVSEIETRYPTKPAEMRAFLIKFFTRHYFQTQDSIIDYVTSQDFLNIVTSGRVRILDVGSGPAVASLAIIEMLSCILEYLGRCSTGRAVKVTCVLNDTSRICLGTGQHMLANYFRMQGRQTKGVASDRIICVQEGFPGNIDRLQWAGAGSEAYDLIVFSYVISPLDEYEGLGGLAEGLLSVERLCTEQGRILITQDKYETALVQRLSRAIGAVSSRRSLTQCVYPIRNRNETYTYTYYSCLYRPTRNVIAPQHSVA